MALLTGLLGCSAASGEEPDPTCDEVLSPNEKTRCRDGSMVEVVRAYRLPDGRMIFSLEGSPRDNPDFYVELTLSAAAQEKAPSNWDLVTSASEVAVTFYDRKKRSEPLFNIQPYSPFTMSYGGLTISEFEVGGRIRGVIRSAQFEDELSGKGVANIPAMRFEATCIGNPAMDDARCAMSCGVCSATDKCGNEVSVVLAPCP